VNLARIIRWHERGGRGGPSAAYCLFLDKWYCIRVPVLVDPLAGVVGKTMAKPLVWTNWRRLASIDGAGTRPLYRLESFLQTSLTPALYPQNKAWARGLAKQTHRDVAASS
jgi:hypothetical protein